MSKIKEYYLQIKKFLDQDVWQDTADAGRSRVFTLQVLRIILLTLGGFKNRLIFLRASALAYSTILAIVPLLALAFSVLKGFGIQTRLENVLIKYLVADQQEVAVRIIEYISNSNFKALGTIGLGLLVYVVFKMLGTAEQTFNDLWGISRARTTLRKLADYISVLIISPFLLALSLTLIASLSSNTIVLKLQEYIILEKFFVIFNTIIPLVGIWIAFTAIYIFLPNTRVKLGPALIAGILCGTVWEIAFKLFADVNIFVARYNAIYGTFAALPIFLIWLYVSWVILLIGAQISYSIQNVQAYQQEMAEFEVSGSQREYMALNLFFKIASHFYRGDKPLTAEALSKELKIPLRFVRGIAHAFSNKGILAEVTADETFYQPARDLHLIPLLEVISAVRDEGEITWRLPEEVKVSILEELLQDKAKIDREQLGQVTMLDLVKQAR